MATQVESNNLAQGDGAAVSESISLPAEANFAQGGDTLEDLTEKAAEVKEHDAIEEEIQQAEKIEEELASELAENDGWVQILGNDQIMKKVRFKLPESEFGSE